MVSNSSKLMNNAKNENAFGSDTHGKYFKCKAVSKREIQMFSEISIPTSGAEAAVFHRL